MVASARPIRTAERAGAEIVDLFHLADDIEQHLGLVDRGERHFHALLDGDRPCAGFDRGGVGTDVIGDGKALGHDAGITKASTAMAPCAPRITGLTSMACNRSPSETAAVCRASSRSTKAGAASGCFQRLPCKHAAEGDCHASRCSIVARSIGIGHMVTSLQRLGVDTAQTGEQHGTDAVGHGHAGDRFQFAVDHRLDHDLSPPFLRRPWPTGAVVRRP